jgi:hypothetical protein
MVKHLILNLDVIIENTRYLFSENTRYRNQIWFQIQKLFESQNVSRKTQSNQRFFDSENVEKLEE